MQNIPKIGTLVVLSSSGAKRNGNNCCLGGWGIVTYAETLENRSDYPIKCKWFVGGNVIDHNFKKYEIKKLKAVKK